MWRILTILVTAWVLSGSVYAQQLQQKDAGPHHHDNLKSPPLPLDQFGLCALKSAQQVAMFAACYCFKPDTVVDPTDPFGSCQKNALSFQKANDELCGFSGAFGGDLLAACTFKAALYEHECSVDAFGTPDFCKLLRSYISAHCGDLVILSELTRMPRARRFACATK